MSWYVVKGCPDCPFRDDGLCGHPDHEVPQRLPRDAVIGGDDPPDTCPLRGDEVFVRLAGVEHEDFTW